MTEQQIQAKILKYLKSENIFAFKTINTNRRGIPDIIVCYEGRFIGLEVKHPGKKPSKIQEAIMHQIDEAGGLTAVVYSVEDVSNILNILKY